jgi:TPR repeat protein
MALMGQPSWLAAWLLPALLLVAAIPAFAADFAEGAAAYDGGDYQTAIDIWRPLADEGDAKAQLAVASMYHFGEGLPQNDRLAAMYYRAAAEQGERVAQVILADFYMTGRGIPRDVVGAYLWYDQAARQGGVRAAGARDDLVALMTGAQLNWAQSLSDNWEPIPGFIPTAPCSCSLRKASRWRDFDFPDDWKFPEDRPKADETP